MSNKNYFNSIIRLYNLKGWLLIALFLFSCSPFFSGVLHVPSLLIMLLLTIFFILITDRVRLSRVIICCFLSLPVIFISLNVESLLYLKRFAFVPLFCFIAYMLATDVKLLKSFVDKYTKVIVVGVFLSYVSFFYYYIGGSSLLSFPNPDGRINNLVLFSFSNFLVGNIMRPAFIYDEPGAFSFIITILVILRVLLSYNLRNTFYILFSGIITLGVTHIIMILIFIFFYMQKRYLGVFLLACVISVGYISNIQEFDFFFKRFTFDENGNMRGDNRSVQVENYFYALAKEEELLFFGNHYCFSNGENICDHGDISSNPLTPLYSGGLLLLFFQIFYYLSLLVMVIASNFKKEVVYSAFVIFCLSLQKPDFFNLNYSLLYSLSFFVIYSVSQRSEGKILTH